MIAFCPIRLTRNLYSKEQIYTYLIMSFICDNFAVISGWSGPYRWPQWSTPKKWLIITFQSFFCNSSSRCWRIPLSTVWRSITLNDGNRNDLLNLRIVDVRQAHTILFFHQYDCVKQTKYLEASNISKMYCLVMIKFLSCKNMLVNCFSWLVGIK